MEELNPAEQERVRRRDRKRVTPMVVDGGNLRRQVQALRERAFRRAAGKPPPADVAAGDSARES
ncbi:MAG TPA: hypothetical protein VMW80_07085 [Candidatus Dormibacteraeota bacterium]|nr:hypothetical protein [Candidatus Dormibacteraeota bacterium]